MNGSAIWWCCPKGVIFGCFRPSWLGTRHAAVLRAGYALYEDKSRVLYDGGSDSWADLWLCMRAGRDDDAG